MLDVSNIANFYSSLKSIPLKELILIYFVGYCLATIIKNRFGSEIKTAFSFSKKTATGFVIFYSLIYLKEKLTFFSGNLEIVSYMMMLTILFVGIALFIYAILSTDFVMKKYFIFYTWILFTSIKKLRVAKKIGEHINISYTQTDTNPENQYSKKYYLVHLISFLPHYLISFILITHSLCTGWFAATASLVLCIFLITTTYLAELKKAHDTWFDNELGFGYTFRHGSMRKFLG